MPTTRMPRTLDLDDKPGLHRRAHKVQTVLWSGRGVVVIGGGLGVCAGGPVSKTQDEHRENGPGVRIERVARHEAPVDVELRWAAPAQGGATVAFPGSYAEAFEVTGVVPQPTTVRTAQNHVYYHFDSSGPVTVIFHLRCNEIGTVKGYVEVAGQRLPLRHWVYP